jgi:hypothetical protein
MSSKIEDVDEILQKYAQVTGVDIDEIRELYENELKDPFYEKDDEYKDPNKKQRYALAVVKAKLHNYRPAVALDVMPIGIEPVRQMKKSGVNFVQLHAYVSRHGEEPKRAVIAAYGDDNIEKARNVSLFVLYNNVKIVFQNDRYSIDTRTIFTNPTMIPSLGSVESKIQFLEKHGVKLIDSISDLRKNLSTRESATNYIVRTDYRMFRGLVSRVTRGTTKTDNPFSVVEVTDINDTEYEQLDSEGNVIKSTVVAWCNDIFGDYQLGTEVVILGTVDLDKDKNPFINAINVLVTKERGD